MKKLKLIVLLSAISICGMAQTFFPKVGISFSWIAASDLSYSNNLSFGKTKPVVGFTYGIGFNIPLNDRFSIQPELSFVKKGTIQYEEGPVEPDDTGATYIRYSRELNINYVELPVLFKFSFGDKTKFFVNAGPSLSYAIGGTSTYTDITDYNGGHSTTAFMKGKVVFTGEPWELGYNDELLEHAFDFGFQLGGGVIIAKRIMIDVRYTHGFINLYAPEPQYSNNTKNRNLQMTIGYPLQLVKK